MKTMYLTSLVVVMMTAACSGAQTQGGDEPGQSQNELKRAAAQAMADGSAEGDVCGQNRWYGDGVCDTFCQDADVADCSVGCGGVVCALFIEESNGYCSRKAEDPCISQDPDCVDAVPPDPAPYPGDEPVACAAIAEIGDGVCKRDPADPCRFQDPDCTVDVHPIEPPGMGGGSEPGDPGGGGGSEPTDPAVPPIACAEYIELSDGVCGRDPADPCIFQDPDCNVK
jgi:hypothetical protein